MLEEPKLPPRTKKSTSYYLQYTGLAFQMAGLLFVAIYVGQKADQWLGLQKPYLTGLFTILALTGFMYKLYLDVMNKTK